MAATVVFFLTGHACMQMFLRMPVLNCAPAIDTLGNHALLCRGQPSSIGFELHHPQVNRPRDAPPTSWHAHQHFTCEDAMEYSRGSRLSKPADILLYSCLHDRHCRIDLVGVSQPMLVKDMLPLQY